MNHTEKKRSSDILKILCPTDFSDSARYAFQTAVMMAERFNASIELFHVIEPSAYVSDRIEDSEKTYQETVRDKLAVLAEVPGPQVPVAVEIATGIPYMEITRRASEIGADLIVIGTHGRTGIRHLLIGSVAEKVVRAAACPVLTVRHPDLDVGLN
ncbi:MAG TPA: universal stress protein [bacterium]|nr:universal stress protein [bacterium]